MLVPGSRYEAVVSKTVHGEDKSGYACLKVQVTIQDIEGDATLWGTIYTSPKAVNMARKQLQALGFNPDAQEFEEIGKSIVLVGSQVKDGVELEEFNGNLKVRNFGLIGGANPKAMKAATAALRNAKKNRGGEEPSVESFDKQLEADKAADAARGQEFAPDAGEDIPF
jgi:hypothetical protein